MNILDEFKEEIIADALDKINKKLIRTDNAGYINAYKRTKNELYLRFFLQDYIKLFFNTTERCKYNINLFGTYNIYIEKEYSLNQFKNFFILENTPVFTFYLKKLETEIAFFGILYKDEKEFKVDILKKENGELIIIDCTLNEMSIFNCTFKEFTNGIKKTLKIEKKKKEKILNEIIEEFDEFLSIVLNLNEEHEKLINPLGKKIEEKLLLLKQKE